MKKRIPKVTLRFKMLSSGRESLYLDYYPAILNVKTGKPTRREFLGMYITPIVGANGKLRIDKKTKSYVYSDTDRETIQTATLIRDKRQNELNKPEVYTEHEAQILKANERAKGDFIKHFENIMNSKEGSNYSTWKSALVHLKKYVKETTGTESIAFSDITVEWCDGFKAFLLKAKGKRKVAIANNTASTYFFKFKTALKLAYNYEYLQKNINAKVSAIPEIETRREFLRLDELKKLVKTPCADDVLKRAALFSALTGLRHIDIYRMKWGQIVDVKGIPTYQFRTKKTSTIEDLPLSSEALYLCGERQADDVRVFDGLIYSAYSNKHLAQWIGNAGITRNITFHSFRHTFATLQLASGTQLTTIQKLLGHKKITTTQIYAKTLDEAKREATEKIKIL
ncbi:MAG TPA: site-specific integrase [Bacteroidales bacterium]|nr:site-specific integrase [Bacteroidales bacterium]